VDRKRQRQRAAIKKNKHALTKLEQRIKAYGAAAGAAGVGLLALAQSANAEIVYTPAHTIFTTTSERWIDLNHDGINDFRIENTADLGLGSTTLVIAFGMHREDGVLVYENYHEATPLPLGASIGPSNQFAHSASMAGAYDGTGGGTWGKNRYLGLQFELSGQKHYGWAELSVALNKQGTLTVEIEGYAYETIADQPIMAGETTEPDGTAEQRTPKSLRTPAPVPATLGLLALGSPGLPIWRRKESLTGAPEDK
jgi:hypothetical protein